MDGDRGNFAEFGKKRNTDYVFLPHYIWADGRKVIKDVEIKVIIPYITLKLLIKLITLYPVLEALVSCQDPWQVPW